MSALRVYLADSLDALAPNVAVNAFDHMSAERLYRRLIILLGEPVSPRDIGETIGRSTAAMADDLRKAAMALRAGMPTPAERSAVWQAAVVLGWLVDFRAEG